MDEFLLLAIALIVAGAAFVGGIIGYELVWKPRRQRRIERDHARSKVRNSSR